MKFRIDIKAIPKGRHRVRMNGRFPTMYTPTRTRDFEQAIGYEVKKHIKTPFKSILGVKLEVFLSPAKSYSQKKRKELLNRFISKSNFDVDNLAKSILDGMNKIAYDDDSQVVELYVSKKYAETDYIEIEIDPVSEV